MRSTVIKTRPEASLRAASLLQQVKDEQAPAWTPRGWWPRATPLWPWAGWRLETTAPTSAPSASARSTPSRSSSSTSSVSARWFTSSVWSAGRLSTSSSPALLFGLVLFCFQSHLAFPSQRRSSFTRTSHLRSWAATAPNTFPWMLRSVFQPVLSSSFQPLKDFMPKTWNLRELVESA